jgi:hypothetical protein
LSCKFRVSIKVADSFSQEDDRYFGKSSEDAAELVADEIISDETAGDGVVSDEAVVDELVLKRSNHAPWAVPAARINPKIIPKIIQRIALFIRTPP